MLWYMMQLACQRYQHWDLERQLKKLGIGAMPSLDLEEITETVAKPLFADCRDSEEREYLLLLTHIAYGFAGRPDDEGTESVKGVLAAMGKEDESSKARTKETICQLMKRWQELYPDFLPSNPAQYGQARAGLRALP